MNPCINIGRKQRQWLWFAALWLGGIAAMGALAAIVRFFMGAIYGQPG
jgi:hypothetical protein